MAYDGITTAAVAEEMNKELAGGYLSKIIQPEADALLISVKTSDGQKKLLLSAQASLPLVYLTEVTKKAPMTAPSFCMLLRKYIGGGHLIGVQQPGLERVLVLMIERRDEMGDMRLWKLIVEIMGKHSNIILVDSDDRIVDAIKHIPSSVSSVREVLPGRTWFIPNTSEKLDPFNLTEKAFQEQVLAKPKPLFKAVYTSLTGISPVMAEELCFRAGLDGGMNAASLTCEQKTVLFQKLCTLMEDVSEKRFSPEMIWRGKQPLEFAAVALTQYKEAKKQSYDSVSSLIEAFYAEKEVQSRIRQKSADLRHIVQTLLERNARTLSLQERQMKDTEKRDKYKLYGELLHTYGYTCEPGADKAEVIDYYTNEPVTIPLEPRLSAMENAGKYFSRYTKLKRTAESLVERIAETRSTMEHLESISTALDMAADERDLTQIRKELADYGYIRTHKNEKKQREAISAPLHFRSSDGFDMYVGKNNYQNEEVSFGIASGEDWWFHAKQMPGSHVIVKTEGKEIPDRTFEEAGRLAAFYSRGKLAPKVEIDYTLKKNLKRPAKAKPGFVVYYTNYSLMAEPDITGIERLN